MDQYVYIDIQSLVEFSTCTDICSDIGINSYSNNTNDYRIELLMRCKFIDEAKANESNVRYLRGGSANRNFRMSGCVCVWAIEKEQASKR